MKKLVHLFFISLLSASPALAQSSDRTSEINFVSGDNGGALAVAEAFYGKSQIMETAVIDLDRDGNAEIAVKFMEGCSDQGCRTTALYFAGDSWAQVFDTRTEALSVSSSKNKGLVSLVSSMAIEWVWDGSVYYPVPKDSTKSVDLEGATAPNETEMRNSVVAQMKNPEKYEYDINNDGSPESIISSVSLYECGGSNLCPVVIMSSDGELLQSFDSIEGIVWLRDNQAISKYLSGFSVYSFDGPRLNMTSEIMISPVTGVKS